ncbi:MAG: hypothetical protein ABL921_32815 [Pirellula sp.]
MALKSIERNARFTTLIALCFSSFLHLCLALALALILIATQGNGRSSILFSVSVNDAPQATPELAELDLSPEPPSLNEETAQLSIELASSATSVDLRSAIANLPAPIVSSDSEAMGRSLASTKGLAQSSDATDSDATSASFFGAQAEGNRFVFVIDSSGSMRGARWTALVYELIRTLRALSPDQEFFILSFDSIAHPMFGVPPPAGKFLRPTPRNVTKVHNWLKAIELGHNTLPSEAVGVAMKLKPDAIFLLSDGEIRDNTIHDLRLWNQATDDKGYAQTKIPIHTILLHSQIGYATLETIANENSGTFTPVPMR